jgi:hypothetical protein
VLTRAERIKVMQEQEKWQEGRSPYGLPKVRVVKHVVRKAKKEKAAETAEGAAAEGAAAPAAGAPPAAADKKPAGKPGGEKK